MSGMEFDFHLRVLDRADLPDWSKAVPMVVRAATRQQAFDDAATALGSPPRGRWWTVSVDRIERVGQAPQMCKQQSGECANGSVG